MRQTFDQKLRGLQALFPGRRFTSRQIESATGINRNRVDRIAVKALMKLRTALGDTVGPEVLEAFVLGRPVCA